MAKIFTGYNTFYEFHIRRPEGLLVTALLDGVSPEDYDYVWASANPTVEMWGEGVIDAFTAWATLNNVPATEWRIVE